MGMLSTGLLDQMRSRAEASFDGTCSIERNTRTIDDQGGEFWAWATVSTGVPCRVGQPVLSPVEQPIAGVVVPQIVVPFTLAHDVDILAADRLIYPESDGHTYFVISEPDYSYKTATRVRAARLS